MPVLKLAVLLLRIEKHVFFSSFARVSILLLGLKNKCRVFRVGSFFPPRRKAPRYMSLKMCRFRSSKRKTKGTWRREGGEGGADAGASTSALCLHSSRSKINSRLHALVAPCIFFCSFSLPLSFSLFLFL